MAVNFDREMLYSLGLCSQCIRSFSHAEMQEIESKITENRPVGTLCSFCFNMLLPASVDHLVIATNNLLSSSNLDFTACRVNLELSHPRCLSVFRLLIHRRIHDIAKIDRSLNLESIFSSLFSQRRSALSSSSSSDDATNSKESKPVRVVVSARVNMDRLSLLDLTGELFPEIGINKRSAVKRKYQDTPDTTPSFDDEEEDSGGKTITGSSSDARTDPTPLPEDENDISNSAYEAIMTIMKRKTAAEIEKLVDLLISRLSGITSESTNIIQLHVSFAQANFYLLGRYNKLSRDVPQSAWTVGGGERKGRASVEEILCAQAQRGLRARLGSCGACAMHACGREDIDVRCLGMFTR